MASSSGWSRREVLAAVAAGAVVPKALLADQGGFSLKNATLLLHTGQRVEGAGVRVEGGVVVELGVGVGGADAVDVGGDWIAPGFTDAGCTLGLVEVGLEQASHDDDEGSAAVTPDARVWDGYNPRSALIPVARVNGITTALVHPEPHGLVTGQAALMRLTGDSVREATALAPAALCVNLGRAGTVKGQAGAPASRMGVAMQLRALFDAVKLPEDGEAAGRKGKKKGAGEAIKPDDELSAIDRVWRQARRGELPVLLHAERADDIVMAIDLCAAYGLRGVLLGGAEAWLVARELADAQLPVLLGPVTIQPDSFEHLHTRYEAAAVLHAAGVRFAFRSGGSPHFARTLPSSAAVAVANGLPFEAAIPALTATASSIFGLEGAGRLEVGAEATFFRVAGDPLQPRYPVRQVWIQGAPTSMETRQTRLAEAFRELR